MKYILALIAVLLCSTPLLARELTLEQIKTSLLSNPPNTGDPLLREGVIMALDSILKDDASRTAQDVFNFYTSMMAKVNSELRDTVVSGATIWMMYNHGFVVKTPQIVMAFDLVDGYYGWGTQLPSELLSSIKVLFVSHRHGDHYDQTVANAVIANGGSVVVPSEDSYMGNVPMAAGDSITIMDLQIKAHYGLHSTSLRIYDVATHNGVKILHTGDNQTSTALPKVDSLDVLLLNAWVNESGGTSAVVGMRNSLDKLNPEIMIPGHIQELGHAYRPDDPTSRVPYEWAFEVDDESIPAELLIMAWGERYSTTGTPIAAIVDQEGGLRPQSYSLHQNYPNPFNPVSTIRYDLPKSSKVSLVVYDILGREVASLMDGYMELGYHEVQWNGQEFPSGIYITRLVTPEYSKSIKMVLLK
jgi:L-ascorbate metabolism protein UlaG (beta-lactamase superfamily)